MGEDCTIRRFWWINWQPFEDNRYVCEALRCQTVGKMETLSGMPEVTISTTDCVCWVCGRGGRTRERP